MANITIPRDVAEKIYDLYNNVVAADNHYKRCQSDNFRVHIKSVYQSKDTETAFAALKEQMSAETERVATAPESRRRGVLSRD